jgi:hypothetical protein
MGGPVGDFALDTVNKGGKKLAKEVIKAYVKGKVDGTPAEKDAAATYAGLLSDAAYDAAMSKPVSTSTLITVAVKGGSAIAGLSDNQKMQCISALMQLGTNVFEVSSQVAVMTGEEAASAGLASPFVIAQGCMLVKSTADAARSAVKVSSQCGPVAQATYQAITTESVGYIQQIEYALQALQRDIERAYGVPGI